MILQENKFIKPTNIIFKEIILSKWVRVTWRQPWNWPVLNTATRPESSSFCQSVGSWPTWCSSVRHTFSCSQFSHAKNSPNTSFTKSKHVKCSICAPSVCLLLKIPDDFFSLTAQMKLFCEFKSARIAIQSIFPIGSIIGLILINLLSDTKGRKVAIQVTFLISIVGILCKLIGLYSLVTIHGGMSRNILELIVAQFMLGFGSYPILPLGYTILYDFVSDSYRPIAVIIVNSVGGLATFLLGVFYLMELDWLNFFLIYTLIPLVVLLLAVFVFLQESPYILMNRNKQ